MTFEIEFNNYWIDNIDIYNNLFINAKPYSHVIINNFFDKKTIDMIMKEVPLPHETIMKYDWKYYCNPIEHKYTLNNFQDLPIIKKVFDKLNDDDTINYLKIITGINNLENDPHLHGAGIHAYPNKGKLDIHLDYNIHPIIHKERRINLIIYLNENWKDEYGGFLELYDVNRENPVKIKPSFNSALIFKTNDFSYHGLSSKINCPYNNYRISLANYYISDISNNNNLINRFKAEYFPRKNQIVSDKLKKLYEIRKTRIITRDDLNDWENWENEGGIYW
jgi:hypothetical protein